MNLYFYVSTPLMRTKKLLFAISLLFSVWMVSCDKEAYPVADDIIIFFPAGSPVGDSAFPLPMCIPPSFQPMLRISLHRELVGADLL